MLVDNRVRMRKKTQEIYLWYSGNISTFHVYSYTQISFFPTPRSPYLAGTDEGQRHGVRRRGSLLQDLKRDGVDRERRERPSFHEAAGADDAKERPRDAEPARDPGRQGEHLRRHAGPSACNIYCSSPFSMHDLYMTSYITKLPMQALDLTIDICYIRKLHLASSIARLYFFFLLLESLIHLIQARTFCLIKR